MKRLSDYKNQDGVKIVGRVLAPISRIVTNPNVKDIYKQGPLIFASAICEHCPDEIMNILSTLSGEDEYICDGASVIKDVIYVFTDPEMLRLFGLQSEITPSSGSVSESTEGQTE